MRFVSHEKQRAIEIDVQFLENMKSFRVENESKSLVSCKSKCTSWVVFETKFPPGVFGRKDH